MICISALYSGICEQDGKAVPTSQLAGFRSVGVFEIIS
jgi:hypothetical protein